MISSSQPPQRLTREGPTVDEVQVIGVELAVRDNNGNEVELDMFPCRHTMPAIGPYGCQREIRVTLHTSRGDITLRHYTTQL